MRISVITCILVAGTFMACTDQTDEKQMEGGSDANISDSLSMNDSTNVATNSDTLHLGSYVLELHSGGPVKISKTYDGEWSADEKLPHTPRIRRTGDSLILTLNNGKTVSLVNIPFWDDAEGNHNMDETVNYAYFRDIGNYWEVQAFCYECNYMVFVNKETGKTFTTIGPGVISPSGNLLFCANIDLEAGFSLNGIELYRKESQGYSLVATRELPWSIHQLRWKNDSTIAGQRVGLTEDMDFELFEVELRVR